MKYEYRSTCRFPILLVIDNEITEVRPNQVIHTSSMIDHKYLKEVVKPAKKPARGRRKKIDGKDNSTSGNILR